MAAKVVVASAFGATLAYGAYNQWSNHQALASAEEEQEKRQLQRLEALQRMQNMQRKRASNPAGGGADERMKAEAALNERRRRVHLFSQQLRSLRGALVKAYKARLAMELVNVPVLGAPETPDAVLVAVLCLWGDVDFFARFVMDPYVQYEMNPDTFDPDDVIDPASLLQFGFTLTTLSDWSMEVLEAWLIGIKEMNTVDGFDTKQVPLAVRTTLMHTLALSRFRSPALFSVCGSGTEHAAGPTKELATRLGLHTVKVSSLARTPRSAGGGVQMRPNKGKLSKLLKRAGMPDTEMWLSNFASEDGFDLGQASVNEQQGTWSYNLEGGVFQRGRGAPVVVGAGVTKEQLVAREEFMVRERLVQEATVLLQRLRGHKTGTDEPCSSEPQGLAVLKGCSLEHCVALSGELELYSHELGEMDSPNLLHMLREGDLYMLETRQATLVQDLCDKLLAAVPEPCMEGETRDLGLAAAAAEEEEEEGEDADGGHSKTLRREVKTFVDQFVQMLRAKYWQTPLSAQHRTPSELVPQQSLGAQATEGLYTDTSQTKMLRYKLSETAAKHDAFGDQLATAPAWWPPVYFSMLLLIVLCMYLVTFQIADTQSIPLTMKVPTFVASAANANRARVLLCHVLSLVMTAWSVYAVCKFWSFDAHAWPQWMYVKCSKHVGLKVPLVRDAVRLEVACRRTMAVWARRQAADDAAAHVAAGVVRDDTALQWMVSVAHTYVTERPTMAVSASSSSSASSPASSSSPLATRTALARALPCHSRAAAAAFLALRVKKAPAEHAAAERNSAAAIASILNGSLQSVRHIGPKLGLLENGGFGNRGEGGAVGMKADSEMTSGSTPAATQETPAAGPVAAAEVESPAQTVEMLLRSHGWRFTYEPQRILFEMRVPRPRVTSAAAAGASATPAESQRSAPAAVPTRTAATNNARRRKKNNR